MQGTVKNFNADRNFGFIETGDGDLFFHISDVEGDTPRQGDKVEFEKTEGDKGPKAVKVKKVTGDAAPEAEAAPEATEDAAPEEAATEEAAEEEAAPERSEERRVGKECRSWWSPAH